MNKIDSFESKRILFLQGPMGSFFKKFEKICIKQGAITKMIGFNGGDWFFSNKKSYVAYKDKKENWENYINNFLISNKIDIVFLFGDCRFYHSIAIKAAKKLNITVYVFEEGYIRPHYITMEKNGVNNFSSLSKDSQFYRSLEISEPNSPQHAKQSKFKMIYSASIYYFFGNILYFRYPYYEHHRDFSAIKELFYGLRGVVRKFVYPFVEKKYLNILTGKLSKKYFFVPLQTYNDFQILEHSGFKSIEKFIIEVLESFAKFAPKDLFLVFKHHPVDRGRKNYKSFILEQAEILNIKPRVIVINDLFLPICIKNARATITINSTVGLTSISKGIPTLTLGNAIYDIEGLTNKDVKLKHFWHKQKSVDLDLYQKYIAYVINHTQLNGSFYGMFPKELKG